MTQYDNLKEDIHEIKDGVRDIFKILNGNGQEGIVTKTALNTQSIKRVWWWLGGISVSIMGIAFFVLKQGLI